MIHRSTLFSTQWLSRRSRWCCRPRLLPVNIPRSEQKIFSTMWMGGAWDEREFCRDYRDAAAIYMAFLKQSKKAQAASLRGRRGSRSGIGIIYSPSRFSGAA